MDTRLSQLERDFASVITIIDRFDTTIEKLTEVSSNVSQLLAVQDKRLEIVEKSLEKMEVAAETRRIESELKMEKTSEQIEEIEKYVKSQLDAHHKSICDKLDSMQKDYKTREDGQDSRIAALEKWMWLLIGGGMVIGFLLHIAVGVITA